MDKGKLLGSKSQLFKVIKETEEKAKDNNSQSKKLKFNLICRKIFIICYRKTSRTRNYEIF